MSKSEGSIPRVDLMTITPTMAANWLEEANLRNRRVSDSHVNRMARDMADGRWLLTHEGIAFDSNGVLLDGQHRLWAIVEANKSIRMYVWSNVSPETLVAINSGRSRTMADILTLSGGHGPVHHSEVAALRMMMAGLAANWPALTTSEMSMALERHREAIAFAFDCIPRQVRSAGIGTSTCRGVMARAFYSGSHERIRQFCQILSSGIMPVRIESIVLLRQYLAVNAGSDFEHRRERYAKTQRALLAYLRDEQLSRLYATTTELFPLPEEMNQ